MLFHPQLFDSVALLRLSNVPFVIIQSLCPLNFDPAKRYIDDVRTLTGGGVAGGDCVSAVLLKETCQSTLDLTGVPVSAFD